jgi:hypothetical protein
MHGKNVVHMTSGTDKLRFFYDAQNRPAVVVYNGTAYAYVKSLQGDIVAILDENGNAAVSYGYDAWGAPHCHRRMSLTDAKLAGFASVVIIMLYSLSCIHGLHVKRSFTCALRNRNNIVCATIIVYDNIDF